jgi:hypothetical protein
MEKPGTSFVNLTTRVPWRYKQEKNKLKASIDNTIHFELLDQSKTLRINFTLRLLLQSLHKLDFGGLKALGAGFAQSISDLDESLKP